MKDAGAPYRLCQPEGRRARLARHLGDDKRRQEQGARREVGQFRPAEEDRPDALPSAPASATRWPRWPAPAANDKLVWLLAGRGLRPSAPTSGTRSRRPPSSSGDARPRPILEAGSERVGERCPTDLLELAASQILWPHRGPPRHRSRDRDGEFITVLGPSRLGQDHGPAADRRLRRALGRRHPLRRALDPRRLPINRRPFNTVFQDYALFPHMTVAENVGYGLMVRRRRRKPQIARAGRRGAATWCALGELRRALSGPALRRPAAARGAGPRHHLRAAADPARRAAGRARCRAAPPDAAASSRRSSARSGPPSCSSPTTRRRRSRWPTGSAS